MPTIGPGRPAFALLAVAWVTLLFLASGRTGTEVAPHLPGPSGNLLHVAAHAGLAVLLVRSLVPWWRGRTESWPGLRTAAGWTVMALSVAHALFDETHQFFIPGRTCSVLDLGLDFLGAVAVLVAPWPRGPGRPATWIPFLTCIAAGVGIAVVGWLDRPFPDRLLESLLSAITGRAAGS